MNQMRRMDVIEDTREKIVTEQPIHMQANLFISLPQQNNDPAEIAIVF